MDNRPIGVFDSGLGGLTCVRSVTAIMPGESIIYFGDTGRVPYGTRSSDTIVKYVKQDINFLRTFDIKQIIIACGTGSSAALPALKDDYEIDIIGVVEPACGEALAKTRNGRIGVLGTKGTVASGKYQAALEAQGASVVAAACPMFVPLVENGYINADVVTVFASEYLKPLTDANVDTVILGCTHYPLLQSTLTKVMGDEVTFIDSGQAAAKHSYEKLRRENMLSDNNTGSVRYFVSDSVDNFAQLGGLFLQREIRENVEKIDIEDY